MCIVRTIGIAGIGLKYIQIDLLALGWGSFLIPANSHISFTIRCYKIVLGIKSVGKKKKHKLLQRNFASGSVMKSKKKVKVFGSKGVSHAIKKPKKIIIPPKKVRIM